MYSLPDLVACAPRLRTSGRYIHWYLKKGARHGTKAHVERSFDCVVVYGGTLALGFLFARVDEPAPVRDIFSIFPVVFARVSARLGVSVLVVYSTLYLPRTRKWPLTDLASVANSRAEIFLALVKIGYALIG